MNTDNPTSFVHSINIDCAWCVIGIVIDALDITTEHNKISQFQNIESVHIQEEVDHEYINT